MMSEHAIPLSGANLLLICSSWLLMRSATHRSSVEDSLRRKGSKGPTEWKRGEVIHPRRVRNGIKNTGGKQMFGSKPKADPAPVFLPPLQPDVSVLNSSRPCRQTPGAAVKACWRGSGPPMQLVSCCPTQTGSLSTALMTSSAPGARRYCCVTASLYLVEWWTPHRSLYAPVN